ncbi:MAG TPA: hypothetical protein VHH88_04645 [Verrucomicrobiae bacterium]|nr:hypothetical protein [Verrucomicrobiae bacterium]
MKKIYACAVLIAFASLGCPRGHADDLFRMTWRGTKYSVGANGKIVAKSFSERDFVNQVAVVNSLNPKALVFVYRPDKHDTAVVNAADGSFVADVIQMEYTYTEVGATDGNRIVRQAFLYDEYHDSALGSAFGTETMKHDADGNLLNDKFHGTFQYSKPDEGTVFSGTFNTGARVKDTSGG